MEDIDMRSIIIMVLATVLACSSSTQPAASDVSKPAPAEASACPACPSPPPCPTCPVCPACTKTDAVFYWVKIRFERGRNPVDLKGTITLHTTDGWFDVATAFTDAIDAENLQPVARQFPHGDALIRHVRAQPDNVGAVTIEDVQYFQEHRTITNFVWSPPDGGGSDRVLMHGTFRLLE
jgi:hypothetical protein